MIFSRLALLPTIAAAILLTIGGFAVPAGASEPVELRIEIFVLGGFHVLTNHTKLVASRDRYEIVMDLDTQNIASLFVDLKSHSEVRGRLTTGAAYPDAYRGDVRRNDTERHYWIDYRADGTVTSDSALPSVALRGTVDQMTAFLIVERQLARRVLVRESYRCLTDSVGTIFALWTPNRDHCPSTVVSSSPVQPRSVMSPVRTWQVSQGMQTKLRERIGKARSGTLEIWRESTR